MADDMNRDWLVRCTRPSRLLEPPTITVLVSTELTRVPAKQQAEAKAKSHLAAMGVKGVEVRESRPA